MAGLHRRTMSTTAMGRKIITTGLELRTMCLGLRPIYLAELRTLDLSLRVVRLGVLRTLIRNANRNIYLRTGLYARIDHSVIVV